jgi:hypothetical protein
MNFDKVSENLKKKGYEVHTFATAKEAADFVDGQVDGTTVAFGGSKTVEALGLYDRLAAHNSVLWHWKVPEGKTVDDLRHEAIATDVYISSVNGLAETGEIINIDGAGNRVASTIYGHNRVIFVVGRNKLEPDYEKAYWRARNISGPKNAVRFHVKTPCAVRGDRCYDCSSPERICRAFSVLWMPPRGSRYEVILIDEDLGY